MASWHNSDLPRQYKIKPDSSSSRGLDPDNNKIQQHKMLMSDETFQTKHAQETSVCIRILSLRKV